MAFNFNIKVPSIERAFEVFTYRCAHLNWYNQNGFPQQQNVFDKLENEVSTLKHSDIITRALLDREMALNEKEEFKQKYLEIFTDVLYDVPKSQHFVEYVKGQAEVIQKCFMRYQALYESWGFKIFPEYRIDVDMYSPMGSYGDVGDCGIIIIGIDKHEGFNHAQTIGHEMIHLGIEKLIIRSPADGRMRLNQKEKERMVDNLCHHVFEDVLDYKFILNDGSCSKFQQWQGVEYIDELVGKQPENNLVGAVNIFLKEQGRI